MQSNYTLGSTFLGSVIKPSHYHFNSVTSCN